MYRAFLTRCAALSFWKIFAYGMLFAILVEAITLLFRFGMNLQSTRDTGAIGAFTFGLRIHHGYIGVFLFALGWCFPRGLRHALWIIAIGLIFSDLAHHFLVLWPLTGSPQFDIFYPAPPSDEAGK